MSPNRLTISNHPFPNRYLGERNETLSFERRLRRAFAIVPLAASLLCAAASAQPLPPEAFADEVFVNGRLFTADAFTSIAQAVAIGDGKFVAVGSNELVRRRIGPKTVVHDLKGGMAMPSITDMHIHPVRGGLAELTYCKFSERLELARTLEAVGKCVKDKQPGDWVEGAQWDAGLAASLDRAALDRIAPNNPVYLHDNTNHIIWVNSAALAAAAIDKSTPDPAGGTILRHPDTGEPTGILMESAIALVFNAKPKPSPEEIERAATGIFQKLNAYGVTSIQTGQANAADLKAFRKLEAEGRLTLRIKTNWDFNTPLAPVSPEQMLERFDTRDERGPVSTLINPDGGKIYADGIAIGFASPYLEPYASAPTYGRPAIDQSRLNSAVLTMDSLGLSIMIHAIGDAAVRSSLDAIESARRANGNSGKRHVVAHTFSVDPSDMGRGRRLNVAFENSPPVVLYPNDLMAATVRLLGRQRTRAVAPIRSLIAAGDSVGYGSDWDNIPEPNPWRALQLMVTRQDPANPDAGYLARTEAVDVMTGLEILTIAGAYGLGLEDRTGSIEVGKDADLIVLNQDLLRAPASEIHKTKVLRTILMGRTIFAGGG